MDGNTALWAAISSKHLSVFEILYHYAAISDPFTAGDLLCTAAKRNDIEVMKELLRHGLNVDAADRHGLTSLQVAMAENHADVVNLLVMNGANVANVSPHGLSSMNLNEMVQNQEIEHRITILDSNLNGVLKRMEGGHQEKCNAINNQRVSIYRGHPLVRKETCCREPGRLIKLPNSLEELKKIAGTFSLHLATSLIILLFFFPLILFLI